MSQGEQAFFQARENHVRGLLRDEFEEQATQATINGQLLAAHQLGRQPLGQAAAVPSPSALNMPNHHPLSKSSNEGSLSLMRYLPSSLLCHLILCCV